MSTTTSGTKCKNHYAIIAGVCASFGSFFGKLSGGATEEFEFLRQLGSTLIVSIICLIFMIICNACVWTFFVKALHSSSGTLTATVTSTAANYFFSFLLGAIVFGERITMFSFIGTSLILVGLIFLAKDNLNDNNKQS